MPGGITPVFEGAIDTGNRTVARTYFEFTSPLVWEHTLDTTDPLLIDNKVISGTAPAPRLSASVKNTSVKAIVEPSFTAAIFDTAGNAFAASATALPRLEAGAEAELVFTWSEPFPRAVGRIDVLPLLPPTVE